MGFFSWRLADTDETLWNKWTTEGATPCKVLCPDGRVIIDKEYDGYGRFAGEDWFDLVEHYCGPGDVLEWERRAQKDPTIPIPKIVSIDYGGTWEDVRANRHCDSQGYWGREA